MAWLTARRSGDLSVVHPKHAQPNGNRVQYDAAPVGDRELVVPGAKARHCLRAQKARSITFPPW